MSGRTVRGLTLMISVFWRPALSPIIPINIRETLFTALYTAKRMDALLGE